MEGNTKGTLKGRHSNAAKLITFFIGVLISFVLLEGSAWLYFHYGLSPYLRDSALYVVFGKVPGSESNSYPKIKPYLWSNYRPNPESPEVNRYGWRYGGGHKKKGTFRILCLGGSTTWSDLASSAENSYPALLERHLQSRGFSVDVVNGGCNYFTSAELVGTLAFRGIYTKPDLVLIHTGGNDTGPFISQKEYQADYSHWRTVDTTITELSNTDTYRVLWKFPSWTTRLLLALYLRPDAFYRQMVAKQLETAQEVLFANNDISHRTPLGLEKNLQTLIALSRTHGASVATITFRLYSQNLKYLIPQIEHNASLKEHVLQRIGFALQKSNETMVAVSQKMNVPVIPFHEFQPSSPARWVDQCHLDDEGCREKAIYISSYIEKYDLIPEEFRQKNVQRAAPEYTIKKN